MGPRGSGKLLAIAGVLCFILAFVLLGTFKGEFGKDTAGKPSVMPVMEDTIDVTPAPSAERGEPRQVKGVSGGEEVSAKWIVYVTGAVKKPGVYEVTPGARVYEALNAAGGFAANADQEAVNLAAKLEDGAQIKFLRKGERADPERSASPPPAGSAQSGVSSSRQSEKININSASQAELESINGVGPKTAQAIIEYRSQNGSFARVEDIMNVKGIGPKKFESMKGRITVGG
ncbi:helix-hairpin-helix domain-containing protein [Cloacibacillus evryensis]|uniref:helix-hairpin-helix domain-containing protein n=1 Tax=Cloacibacillus evryensis TaxID=508460 RepID=UPI00210ABE11|nr:helix-hairpin-helix domain-containing protein [Cloacibacillus evryensis]MCQ4764617.1 helix-hairpin-helix domain-containing protein [Cloacibacillus evryensis]